MKIKIILAIILLLSVVMLAGCVDDTPSGYINFDEEVILNVNESYSIEGTDFSIVLKDVEKEQCVLYAYEGDQLFEKHFFEEDDSSHYDFEFDEYRVRFIRGTSNYAKLDIFKEE